MGREESNQTNKQIWNASPSLNLKDLETALTHCYRVCGDESDHLGTESAIITLVIFEVKSILFSGI